MHTVIWLERWACDSEWNRNKQRADRERTNTGVNSKQHTIIFDEISILLLARGFVHVHEQVVVLELKRKPTEPLELLALMAVMAASNATVSDGKDSLVDAAARTDSESIRLEPVERAICISARMDLALARLDVVRTDLLIVIEIN